MLRLVTAVWRNSYYLFRRKPNGFPKSFITQNIFLKFTATTPRGGANLQELMFCKN